MKRRSGLGRGLDALLPGSAGEPESRNPMRLVDPADIGTNPRQPRRHFDEAAVAELAASIVEIGVLQPLLVREVPGAPGLELIAGERRLRAARRAGLERIPVLVVETDETGSLERALVENIHRTDLNPLEEAAAYKQLLDEGGLTQEQLGERVGRNRVTITNALRLLELPPGIKRLIVEARISAGHARALLPLNGNPFQERLARRIQDEGLSVRATEEMVGRYVEMMPAEQSSNPRARPEQAAVVAEAQRRLQDRLQTRVRITRTARKGKITIDFAGDDELARLVRVLGGEEPGGAASTVSPDR